MSTTLSQYVYALTNVKIPVGTTSLTSDKIDEITAENAFLAFHATQPKKQSQTASRKIFDALSDDECNKFFDESLADKLNELNTIWQSKPASFNIYIEFGKTIRATHASDSSFTNLDIIAQNAFIKQKYDDMKTNKPTEFAKLQQSAEDKAQMKADKEAFNTALAEFVSKNNITIEKKSKKTPVQLVSTPEVVAVVEAVADAIVKKVSGKKSKKAEEAVEVVSPQVAPEKKKRGGKKTKEDAPLEQVQEPTLVVPTPVEVPEKPKAKRGAKKAPEADVPVVVAVAPVQVLPVQAPVQEEDPYQAAPVEEKKKAVRKPKATKSSS